jgi:hypothetical protein
VAAVSGERLAYAPLASAERPQHTTTGRLALPGSGTATLALPAGFVAACDLGTLVVTLTPVGVPMSGLYVTTTAAGFTVHGGVKGTVFWSATADRTPMDLPKVPTAATALTLTRNPSGVDGLGHRLLRRPLRFSVR